MSVRVRRVLVMSLCAALAVPGLLGCDGDAKPSKDASSDGSPFDDGSAPSDQAGGDVPDDGADLPDDGHVGDGSNGGDPGEGGNDSPGDLSGDGDGTNGGGDDGGGVHGTPTLPSGRGATMPFTTYEAEDMETNGQRLGPSTTFGEVAAEASNRRAVRLSAEGHYVSFRSKAFANAIVVRYSIPDGGHDYWNTVNVYVDGELRAHLPVTSRYSWTYGGDDIFNKPEQEDSSMGLAHHFFDETRAIIGAIPEGATVMVRKDADNTAQHYDIDLVDLEPAPEPYGQPPGSLSITECGAVPDDGQDDSGAIQACVDRARREGRVVYIPKGVFHSYSQPISVPGVTIRGAGMWHSVVQGYHARFDCWTGGCHYRDFAVFGDTVRRIDDEPTTAFGGNGSSDSSLENIWIEHAKTGYWTGPETNNLTIRNTRFRNLFADGVNLYGGTSDSRVENCHARNTGDDAFAAWSHGPHPANRNNVFTHNYVQLPWRANCFAVYGGENTVISDNVCVDVVQYPGILLARQFDSHSFTGTTRIERNTLIRAGGFAYGQGQGAFKLHADQGPIQNIVINDLDIIAPTFFGVHVQGENFIDSVWFDAMQIVDPGQAAFYLNWGANGAMDVANAKVTGAPSAILDDADGRFTIFQGAGNSGW